jgi:hypothetical protein
MITFTSQGTVSHPDLMEVLHSWERGGREEDLKKDTSLRMKDN